MRRNALYLIQPRRQAQQRTTDNATFSRVQAFFYILFFSHSRATRKNYKKMRRENVGRVTRMKHNRSL